MKKLPPLVHVFAFAAGVLCLFAAYFIAFRGRPGERTRGSQIADAEHYLATAEAAAAAGKPISSEAVASVAKANAPRTPRAFSAEVARTPQTSQIQESTSKLREWLNRYEGAATAEREPLVAEGMDIARKRRSILLGMFSSNPEGVLAHSLSFDEYARTPESLLPLVEKPFSTTADYTCVPVCPGGEALAPRAWQVVPNEMTLREGDRLKVYTLGARREIGSKRDLPVQGVALEGMAVMRDGVFQRVLPGEAPAVERMFESAQQNSSVSFATGEAIAGEPVRAVAGGKLFSFANEEELVKFDKALASLDAKPGPQAASRLIFALPYQADGGAGGFNFEAAQFAAAAAAENWTCSPKRVFIIRVDFSDKAGEPISKEAAESALAGSAATAVAEMSYGKTSISGTVSANIYRMPNPSTAYAGTLVAGSASFTSLNTDLLRDAKAVFRTLKSGLDAGVNIGGDDQSYGEFDVVGVYFADIGAYNAGVKYAGLASLGKGDLWMQGSNEPKVYVHEFGHIYGLGHSNFWLTTDQTSAVGAGAEKEYGDVYDVMGSGELPQGHFHPQAKHRLFWLGDNQCELLATADGARTLRLYRIDSAIDGSESPTRLRGIRIPKATGEYYWIGYRGAYSDNPHLSRGAYLLWQRSGQDNSCLIDSLPATLGDKTDAALHVGRTYSDASSTPNAEVHITPIGFGGTNGDRYIDLRINQGTFTGNNAPTVPSITFSGTLRARTEILFEAPATDADGDELAYFWSFSDGTVSGGTGVSASSFAHSFIVGGSQTVTVTVSDMKGGVRTESTALDIYDPVVNFTAGGSGSGTEGDLLGIATNGVLLVAVGTAGSGADKAVIRTSSDGVIWTSRSVTESTLNLKLRAVHWSGQRFVAVGTDYSSDGKWVGVIYTSENGASWTRRYTATQAGTGLHCVSSGNGSYVVGGEGGALLQSSDGLTWQPLDNRLPATHKAAGIAYGAGTFVLTAHRYDNTSGSGEARVLTSSNGIDWTDYTSGSGIDPSWQDLREIAFLNDRFVASGWKAKLRVSTDGGKTFFTTRTATEEMRAFGYYGGLYFASGFETIGSGSLESKKWVHMYSMDGERWDRSDSAHSGVSDAVVFGGRIMTVSEGGSVRRSEPVLDVALNNAPVIGGLSIPSGLRARSASQFTVNANDQDGDGLAYLWSFSDGTIGGGTSEGASSFSHSFIVGGSHAVTVTVSDMKGGVATYSEAFLVYDPSANFAEHEAGSGTDGDLFGIATNGTLMVAVGTAGSGADKSVIRTSSDGVVWTGRSVLESTLNLKLRAVHWSGERFVAVGTDYSSDGKWVGVIYTSENGASWTRRYTGAQTGTGLHCVSSGNGSSYVAGGEGGALLHSPNGVNWELLNVLPATHKAAGVAFGAGTFVLTAHRYDNISGSGVAKVLVSTDGKEWTDYTAGSGIDASWQDLREIAFLNDRFVASGWKSKLRVSTDGGKTFSTTRTGIEEIRALSFHRGLYFASGFETIGSGSSAVKNHLHLYSVDGVNWISANAVYPGVSGAVVFGSRIFTSAEGGIITFSEPLIDRVSNTPPSVVQVSIPQTLGARSMSLFTASAQDADGDGLTYSWDAGDGFGIGVGETFHYSWLAGGSYDLTVTVSDGSGASVSQKTTVFVDDPLKRFEQRSVSLKSLKSIAASSAVLVAVGDQGEIRTSADGETWQNRSITSSQPNVYFQGVTWDGSRFVAVGQDHDSAAGSNYVPMGVVYVSTDGISWTRVHNSVSGGTIFQTVAASSGTILVGDNLGKIFRSTDGTSWSQFQIPYLEGGTYVVGGLTYGAGTFALAAHKRWISQDYNSGQSKILTSASGGQSLWTDRSGGMNLENGSWQDLRQISYANDRFVASGFGAKLRVSTDGGLSFRAVLSEDTEAAAVGYGNGVYFGISKDYENAAPVHFVSVDGERWVQTDAQSMLEGSVSAAFFKDRFFVIGQGSISVSGTIESALQSPSIVVQPVGGQFEAGQPLGLYVEAGGSPPFQYKWKKDGVEIPAAFSKSYLVTAASAANAGSYSVVVYGNGSSVESRIVSVQVTQKPVAVGDTITITAGSNNLNVLGNDSDGDGSGLVISSVTTFAPSSGGTVSLSGGSLLFTPTAQFSGGSFQYTIRNGAGVDATAGVQLTAAAGTISASVNSFTASGGTSRVVVTAFGDNAIANVPEWITYTVESDGAVAGVKTYIFAVAANTSLRSRTAQIQFGSLAYMVSQEMDSANGLQYAVISGGTLSTERPTSGVVFYYSGRLPVGLFLNRSTGVITGRPQIAGDYTIQLKGYDSQRLMVYAKEIQFHIEAFSPTLTGQYVGLVDRNDGENLRLDLGARLDCAVSSSGRVSGRVSTPYGRATFVGMLQTTISAPKIASGTFNLNFRGGPNTLLSLELNGNGQEQILAGSITAVGGGTSAAISGWRNPWENTQATSFAGRYHFYLQNAQDTNIPLGYGYGAALVSRFRGGVMLWGRLPDSSGISSSSFLSKNGGVLAYSPLYSGGGSCRGVLAIEKSDVPPSGNSIGNSSGKPLVWSKNEAGLRDLKVAPPQFTGVELEVQGGIFSSSNSMVSRARLAVSNAGTLSFIPSSTDSVTSTFGQTVSFYPVGGVQVRAIVSPNTAQLSLTPISPFDGLFSGTFSVPPVHPDTIPYRARFSGQIVSIGSQSTGYGFFIAPAKSSSALWAGSLMSGTVTLSPP